MINFNNLAKLTQFYDVQPYLSIKVGGTTYSSIGSQPRFLNIDDFSQTNEGQLDYTISLHVTLSDYDGAFKTLFDNGTLLDQVIQIIQNFQDSAQTDVLFTGRISAPINWNEADRTISFDVENGVQDVMMNDFDPIDDCKQEIMPMCFGEVLGVKGVNSSGGCVQISKTLKPIMSTVINSSGGKTTYESGDLYIKNGQQIFGTSKITLIIDGTLFTGSFSDNDDPTHFDIETDGIFNDSFRLGSLEINPRDDEDQRDYLNHNVVWLSDEAYDCVGKFLRLSFQTNYWYVTNSDGSRSATTENDPNGVQTTETNYTCTVLSGIEGLKGQLANAPLDRFGRPVMLGWELDSDILEVKGKMDFKWSDAPTYDYPSRWDIPAGTTVELYSGTKVTWYFSQQASQAIVAVYGMKGDKMTKIPESWYTTNITGPTSITFDRNLTGKGGFDSNEVWADIRSWSGSENIARVIKWLAENYCTDLTVDNTSYTACYNLLTTLPCGFALTEQKRSFDLMKELAYQGGLGLNIINNVLYFKDITQTPTTGHADYTVSSTYSEFRSFNISTDDDTNVITHFIGTYRESYYPNDEVRRMVKVSSLKTKFKKLETTYDFFAFNQKDCVDRVMSFYMNRFSNLWQQVNVKVFLSALNINPFDKVELTIPYSDATFGIVDKISYDPKDYSVALLIKTDKGIYSGTFWSTLVGTTPESLFYSYSEELDSVYDTYYRNPTIQLVPVRCFSDDPNANRNNIDLSNINTTLDSAVFAGKITSLNGDYFTVDMVDPYDHSKTFNFNNLSPVNKFPTSMIPASTGIKVAKPLAVRSSTYNGKSYTYEDGTVVSYANVNNYTRTATNSDGSIIETQVVTPAYAVGQVALFSFNGHGTGVVDDNGDPVFFVDNAVRAFAKKIPT